MFGVLKRGGRVYTTMLPNVSRTTLVPIINTKVTLDSVVYTDGYFAYDNLVAIAPDPSFARFD